MLRLVRLVVLGFFSAGFSVRVEEVFCVGVCDSFDGLVCQCTGNYSLTYS